MTLIRRVGHRRERDERFRAWIQRQPEWRCLITLAEHPEPAHLRSKGAGGSDYWLLPLCFDEHRLSHSKPEWWYRHRVAVAEWIAFLPTLWARYRFETWLAEEEDSPDA